MAILFCVLQKMRYTRNIVRKKSRVIEYVIYSFFDDGSFNDIENIVVLPKNENIEQYIKDKY